MIDFLKSQTKDFQSGVKAVKQRRLEWPEFENRATGLLQTHVDAAQAAGYYERLYIQHESLDQEQENQNILRFFAGKHSTGVSEKNKPEFEDGGCLSFVQLPTGKILVLIYPSRSELMQWKEEYILYGHFTRPSKISNNFISKAVRFYLRFSLITSYACEPTHYDEMKLWWLKFRFRNLLKSVGKGAYYGGRLAIAAKTGGLIH